MSTKLWQRMKEGLRAIRMTGTKGMSLIEIILVIALMGTLMTIIFSNVSGRNDQAMADTCRLAMGNMQNYLQLYKVHNYRFPTTDEGLQALLKAPAGATRWRGPYVEDESKLRDPWDTPYFYESDGNSFTIRSAGKGRKEGDEDDIIWPEPTGESKTP